MALHGVAQDVTPLGGEAVVEGDPHLLGERCARVCGCVRVSEGGEGDTEGKPSLLEGQLPG